MRSLFFKTVFQVCVVLGFVIVFVILMTQGIDKDITRQCVVLQDQSRQYKEAGFYLTHFEKTMCDGIGITIDAPVK